MRKSFMATLLAAALFMPALASADDEVWDVSKITCKELLTSDETEKGLILFWIDGYMSAKSNNTKISNAWMEKLGANIGFYCAANPGKTIMAAVPAE